MTIVTKITKITNNIPFYEERRKEFNIFIDSRKMEKNKNRVRHFDN